MKNTIYETSLTDAQWAYHKLLVDTLGLVLGVAVTPPSTTECEGAH